MNASHEKLKRMGDLANLCKRCFYTLCLCICLPVLLAGAVQPAGAAGRRGLTIENGWFVQNGRIIWGYAQHNGWWRAGRRPNITRNAPGRVGPNRTEDLDKLTDAMLRFAYPGFEHNFGLWYDRRRDAHDTRPRLDAHAVGPFLEQPWARSRIGRAADGLPLYDLTRFNSWYFKRLKAFADLCDRKGTILFHNQYMQHALLERQAHYVDFPWRPANCIQQTALPDRIPAADAFYDTTNPVRRKLHRMYINKTLDVLGYNHNVVFLCSQEYTGPLSFMRFWLDTVFAWEDAHHQRVLVAVNGTRDVVDAVLADPTRRGRISVIDLRYWWYTPDGRLFAPAGGRQIPGRFTGAFTAAAGSAQMRNIRLQLQRYVGHGMRAPDGTTAQQIYRQVREYRDRFPHKAILHQIPAGRRESWAFLMAGGSLLIGQMPYAGGKDPRSYESPEACRVIQPTYNFIRRHMADSLWHMRPADRVRPTSPTTWCLSDPGHEYLVYAMQGGKFGIDLSTTSGTFLARWLNPRSGRLAPAKNHVIKAGRIAGFATPDRQDWALWLHLCQGPPNHNEKS